MPYAIRHSAPPVAFLPLPAVPFRAPATATFFALFSAPWQRFLRSATELPGPVSDRFMPLADAGATLARIQGIVPTAGEKIP